MTPLPVVAMLLAGAIVGGGGGMLVAGAFVWGSTVAAGAEVYEPALVILALLPGVIVGFLAKLGGALLALLCRRMTRSTLVESVAILGGGVAVGLALTMWAELGAFGAAVAVITGAGALVTVRHDRRSIARRA